MTQEERLSGKKMEKSNKIADLSVLPPCQSSLAKHSRRSYYIVYTYTSQNAYRPMMNLESPTNNGWLPDRNIDWIEEPYPEDVRELFVTSDNDTDVAYFPIDNSYCSQ